MIYRKLNNDLPYNKLRLHSSERNSNWSNNLFDQFVNSITQEDIKFYPNLETLYSKLKKHYNTDYLIIGNGSDRCIEYFFQINSNKDLIISNPTFPMYEVYGKLYKCNIKSIKYNGLNFPIEEYLNNITQNSICVFSNPSSPIGDIVKKEDIKKILDTGVPVLVDEAYIEFSEEKSIIDWIPRYNNLFITRTFSKAYGSAGMRLGIITSQKTNIELMYQYRPMYEINNLTSKWSILLLDNIQEIEKYIFNVKKVKNKIVKLCKQLGFIVINSNCNWIHVKNMKKLPSHVIFKENCTIPDLGDDWLRLQITDNFEDYNWLKNLN